MATIKDVARAARVSVSTVSHVLSGHRPISEATRKRVLEAVAALNYHPNRLAQGLVNGNSRSLGLLVPDLANPFFSSIAEAMEVSAHELGYSIILCNTNLDPAREAAYLSVLLARQVDGLLYFPGTRTPNAALMQAVAAGVPLVVIDERLDDLSGVFVDNFDGGFQVGKLLGEKGHRSLLFLGGPEGLPTVVDRLNGVRAGLEAVGVSPRLSLRFGEYRAAHGYDSIHASAREGLFHTDGQPTAVVAANDLIAIGALRALRELHVEVPRDCSLVGFDGIELTSLVTPSLTTVQQPFALVARSAVHQLLSRIGAAWAHVAREDGAAKTIQVVLPVSLVVRESVAEPAKQPAYRL
jgi:LacI family transcriptional regulator